jgi:uncharacterized protein (DUF2252 family)
VRNFGTFARFDGTIAFDINDFDETYRGPFEWDLKRLAASIILAGREAGHDDGSCKEAVRACIGTYRQRMHDVASCSPFDIMRKRASRDEHADVIDRLMVEAKRKSHEHLLDELTEIVGTTRRFKEKSELIDKEKIELVERVGAGELPRFSETLEGYRKTLSPAMQLAFGAYQLVDVAFKVVGVGSVGLAAYAALMSANNETQTMILQLKQARQSTIEVAMRAAGLPTQSWSHEGKRVVDGQRAMQTQEDRFVGYTTHDSLPFMVRQLAENKAAVDNASIQNSGLLAYAKATGNILALSHAVTGDPLAIAAYLGNSDTFDRAIGHFALAYAQQAEDDAAQFNIVIAGQSGH